MPSKARAGHAGTGDAVRAWALAALCRLGGDRELLERKGLVAVGGVGSGDGGVEGAQELVLRGAARAKWRV